MTIREALSLKSLPTRELEVLLTHTLKKDRSFLHTHPETLLRSTEEGAFFAALERRLQHKPIAYIIGQKEFFGRPFFVDESVLIPRPDTEVLIEHALPLLSATFQNALSHNTPCPVSILELGTGSGAISITLATELTKRNIPHAILATDISHQALEIAQKNYATLHSPSRVSQLTFLHADLFDHEIITKKAPFDCIVANLPYVSTAWHTDPAAQPEVIQYEPAEALYSGSDGLDHYRRFFNDVSPHIKKGGSILIEYGMNQKEELLAIITKTLPGSQISEHADYAGQDRVLQITTAS